MYTFPEGDITIVIKFITELKQVEKRNFAKKKPITRALSAPSSKQPTIPHNKLETSTSMSL